MSTFYHAQPSWHWVHFEKYQSKLCLVLEGDSRWPSINQFAIAHPQIVVDSIDGSFCNDFQDWFLTDSYQVFGGEKAPSDEDEEEGDPPIDPFLHVNSEYVGSEWAAMAVWKKYYWGISGSIGIIMSV